MLCDMSHQITATQFIQIRNAFLQIMATTMTMQDLCNRSVPSEDKAFHERLIAAIDKNYPEDWRSWKTVTHSYHDLFGDEIAQTTDAKLRFALPTDDLKKIFFPDDTHLSERHFRAAKKKLLEWDLGRAIIYSPHKLVDKVYDDVRSYEAFMSTAKQLKDKITPIRGSSAERLKPDEKPKRRSNTSHTEEDIVSSTPKKARREPNYDTSFMTNVMNLLAQHTQAITDLSQRVAMTSQTEEPNPHDSPDQSFESSVDSTQPDEDEWRAPTLCSPPPSIDTSTHEETLKAQITEAQRKLAEMTASKNEAGCDFSPNTIESESKITKANPKFVEQAKTCQRFGEDSWKNIRYADVQKNFQATPAFCALKVNNHLAANTPNWQSLAQLEKFDLILAAITHGLLQQREAFQEAFKTLDIQMQKELNKVFLGPDSKFKKISDQLLQYTCGRRAEIIQTRRETYKSNNKVLNEILHDIPPSETHLFSEEKLTEIMKDQGGANRFFPKKAISSATRTAKTSTSTSRNRKQYSQSQPHWKCPKKGSYRRRDNKEPSTKPKYDKTSKKKH